MFWNRLTVGALAVACVAAAGAGGYFATRQNAVPAPVAASSAAPLDAVPSDHPVTETEAVVSETPRNAEAPSASLPRRTEPARTSAAPGSTRSTSSVARQNPRSLERPWPSNSSSQSAAPPVSTSPATTADSSVPTASIDDRAPIESPRAPEPPQKVLQELVVSANSVIGLETQNRISTETARIEDRVEAKVTRDVKVGDMIAIPAGSRAIGSVIQVDRGGKFKDRARLGIRFTTVVLADGTRLPMSTETIFRESEAPGNSSAAKIGGGAVGGAILGAILGGAKGAAIGATAGAGGGVAVVEAGDRQEVSLPAGSPITVRLLSPLTVTVEQ
jgi:type IV secretory pathway VirB10-like protein